MRILLDESLPKDFAPLITGHDVSTVKAAGWSGIKNGKLLTLASSAFDVFVTADRNLEFQQNLSALPIAVVVPVARIAQGSQSHCAVDAAKSRRVRHARGV